MKARLGIAGPLVPRTLDGLTEDNLGPLREAGVSVLVTHLEAQRPTPAAEAARKRLADAGVVIAQAAGVSANLVCADEAERAHELERLREALLTAAQLGAESLITGCGTLHPTFFYGPHPDNHAPQTVDRLVDSLTLAARAAEDVGVPVLIECHQLTTMSRPEVIREVLDRVDSPWVLANFDPVNLLASLDDVYGNAAAMTRMVDVVGTRYAASAHLKDVTVRADIVLHLDEVAPGEGYLDVQAFMDNAARLDDPITLVVEHLPREASMAALASIRELAPSLGVEWVEVP